MSTILNPHFFLKAMSSFDFLLFYFSLQQILKYNVEKVRLSKNLRISCVSIHIFNYMVHNSDSHQKELSPEIYVLWRRRKHNE